MFLPSEQALRLFREQEQRKKEAQNLIAEKKKAEIAVAAKAEAANKTEGD